MEDYEAKAREIVCPFLELCTETVHASACDELTAAITSALSEAVKAEREWRTIDSAPKDVPILVWDGERYYVAQHMTAVDDGSTNWVYARQLGAPGEAMAFVVRNATHWQPLPSPPSEDR